jgi:hypothetical protein
MLVGEATLESQVARVTWSFDTSLPWIPEVCASILKRTGEHFHYFTPQELARLLLENATFSEAFRKTATAPVLRRYCLERPMRPPAPDWLTAFGLPDLATVGDLAAWFGIPIGELEWFADQWRMQQAGVSPLQHYHYRLVAKRSGGMRLIEIPKKRLRLMQRKILREILDLVPVHDAAHGFRRGHSPMTHARQHAGKRVVVRMDLKDFFPSIRASRVEATFVKLGYARSVAGVLARLCVNRTPGGVFSGSEVSWFDRQAYKTPHLPQGSPCSPALANLCAFRLDMRLQALAQSIGAQYSRYADDLAFSGGDLLHDASERLQVLAGAIALEEGFRINMRKTRVMRAAASQQVTGIVVNRHPNIARADYDRLKAILTNCVRHGPESQNREGRDQFRTWLVGKVAHVTMINPARGERLQRLYTAIAWPSDAG